ncbi:MAG: DUF4115 domain-containing protein [Candidatus Omnitrophica bacterium]|nr:DUF4115 domain-containing protein [Candidatus Omnitrophota bacterium]
MKNRIEETTGERLKRERLKRNLTFDDVYKSLKIHPGILKSLEENKISPEIGDVYIRSFLKIYAKFLGLGADKAVLDPPVSQALKRPQKKSFIDTIKEKEALPLIIKDRFKKTLLPVTAVFAVLFIASVISYAGFRLIGAARNIKSASSEAAIDKEEAVAPEGTLPIPKDKPLELKIETKDSVWLRVKSDGKIVFEHTLPKESVERWTARDKLELRIGRPKAVSLTLNGKDLDLPDRPGIKNITIDREGLKLE